MHKIMRRISYSQLIFFRRVRAFNGKVVNGINTRLSKYKYKGVFGGIRLCVKKKRQVKVKVNKVRIRKYIMVLYSLLRLLNQVKYGSVSVIGRGMHLESFLRGLVRGSLYNRRFRKYTRPRHDDATQKRLKEFKAGKTQQNIKTKTSRKGKRGRRRRRLSLKSFNRRNWFLFRKLDRRTITHFGERGHFMVKHGGFRLFFKRLNTLYKYLMFSVVGTRAMHLIYLLNLFLLLKQFNRYKIKGLKFFHCEIRVKEGKGRRF